MKGIYPEDGFLQEAAAAEKTVVDAVAVAAAEVERTEGPEQLVPTVADGLCCDNYLLFAVPAVAVDGSCWPSKSFFLATLWRTSFNPQRR